MTNRQFRYLLTFLLTAFMAGLTFFILSIFKNENIIHFLLGNVIGVWSSAVVFHYNGDDSDENGQAKDADEIPDRVE